MKIFFIEVLRVTAKNDENRDYTTAGGSRTEDTPNGDSPSSKKPRYRTYQGAVVTEEIVKLSEKVVVPVKEYPKVRFQWGFFIKHLLNLSIS